MSWNDLKTLRLITPTEVIVNVLSSLPSGEIMSIYNWYEKDHYNSFEYVCCKNNKLIIRNTYDYVNIPNGTPYKVKDNYLYLTLRVEDCIIDHPAVITAMMIYQ